MNRIIVAVLLCAALWFPATHAAAEDPPGPYTMKSTGDGLIRLNTKTGAISTCRRSNGNLVCRAAADDRAVLQREIDQLQKENEALKRSIAALKGSGKATKPLVRLPDDEDFDRIMGFFEKLVKRFFNFARTVRESLEEGET